ncbi:MAG: helix-hairpin-helix domain-containing protein, partial [Bacteroidota bacterium]
IQLNLSYRERSNLRKNKVRISEILDYAVNELEEILSVSPERAREVYALADFQRIPSIGIRFAEDLTFLGYYSVDELRNKDGALLTDTFEKKKGYSTDVCVEDQFRLAVHFANTNDYSKNWWDFTQERKKFRIEMGYPKDRPKTTWQEIVKKT